MEVGLKGGNDVGVGSLDPDTRRRSLDLENSGLT